MDVKRGLRHVEYTVTTAHGIVIVLALVGMILTLVALSRLGERPFTKIHHIYWGLLLTLAPASWGVWAVLLWLIGLALISDDWLQHRRQKRQPYYLSPLHRLYERVYRAIFRKVAS